MAFTFEEMCNIGNATLDWWASEVAGMTRLEVAKQKLREAELEFRRAQRELLRCRKVRTLRAKEERAALKAGEEVYRYPVRKAPALFAEAVPPPPPPAAD